MNNLISNIKEIKINIDKTLILLFIFIVAFNLKYGFNEVISALIYITLAFLFIFLHEIGHSVAAIIFGLKVKKIYITFIGGIAEIPEIDKLTSGKKIITAISGPFVNIILALLLMLYSKYNNQFSTTINNLFYLNIGLAIFNLIPAFPLDGGIILKEIMNKIFGVKIGTILTIISSQVFATIGIIVSILSINVILFFISLFVFIYSPINFNKKPFWFLSKFIKT